MCDSSLQTITLPASIESIGVSAFFRCAALGNLVTKATTPPGATPLSFHGIPATCTLTVPCETSQDYTDEWGSFNVFAEIVEDCRDEFTVTVTSHDPTMGSAMVDGEPSAIVLAGDEAILTAVANEGYHFVRWNDDSTDNPRIIIVTDNITYTAYFEVGEDVSIGNVNASSALIYVADGRIVIESENEATPFLACVYDMTGRQVAMLQSAGKTPALPSGVYLVRLGDKSVHKVVVKNN